jgi:brefeldin A-resistance guanine nucleotide exchange factor 1
MSQDVSNNKGPTPEEQETIKSAQSIVDECHIEQLIHDTKFLRVDSLLELIKALIFLSQSNEQYTHSDNDLIKYDQDAAVFSLEILIKVVLQNRDRISCIWLHVRNHFYNIICQSTEYTFFLERTVIGLLRISARLLRREELANEVLSSLRMLLLIKNNVIRKISRQIAYGLHDLLRTNAANIHSNDDWVTLFSILQVIGAGAPAPPIITSPLAQMSALSGESKLLTSCKLKFY